MANKITNNSGRTMKSMKPAKLDVILIYVILHDICLNKELVLYAMTNI